MTTAYGYTISHQTLEVMRGTAVRMVRRGIRVADVAAGMQLNRSTVFGWMHRYHRHGMQALQATHGAGAPSKLTQKQILTLIRMLRQPAVRHGFGSDLWTGPRVRVLIRKHFHVSLHRGYMPQFLRRLGLVRKHPERRALEQDPKAVRRWQKRVLPTLVRAAKRCGGLILYGDEALFVLIPHIGKTWTFPDTKPIARVSGRRGVRVGVTSAVSPKGHLFFQFSRGNFTAQTLIRFMDVLHAHFHQRKLFFIVDGAPSHRAKAIERYAKANGSWLRLERLPGYSPELNPDEEVWNHVKTRQLNARPMRDKTQLRKAVRHSLQTLQKNPTLIKTFFTK